MPEAGVEEEVVEVDRWAKASTWVRLEEEDSVGGTGAQGRICFRGSCRTPSGVTLIYLIATSSS
jgi:hypothetical protein